MKLLPAALLLLGVLAPALGCDWDWDRMEERGLYPGSFLGSPTNVTDPGQCKDACCAKDGCDAALVGSPQDGDLQCYLVTCWIQGSDQCRLVHNPQFQVHRRRRQDRAEEKNQTRCRLPMKVGPCRAAFPRFFYNVTEQSCRSFLYGGCDANANNFESKEHCEAACGGATGSVLPDGSRSAHDKAAPPPLHYGWLPETISVSLDKLKVMSAKDYAERCTAELEVGPCRAALPRWHYDSKNERCERFLYGGCRGNLNNYNSEQKCTDTCAGVSVLPSSRKTGAAEGPQEDCVQPPDAGRCRAAFSMFYYDPDTNSCQAFIYGGCLGNGNRYSSREACLQRCGVDGWFNSGRTGRHWTAGLFLFITLAAISALLLAALIIFTVKRRGFTHVTSSISDKQELLPEVEDELSVSSLSLPESPKANQA